METSTKQPFRSRLFRNKRDGIFYVDVTLPERRKNGKHVVRHISTGIKDPDVAHAWYETQAHKFVQAHNAGAATMKFASRLLGYDQPGTIEEMIAEYVQWMRTSGRSDSTIKQVRGTLNRWISHCGLSGATQPHMISRECIGAFVNSNNLGIRASSRNIYLAHIKMFTDWLCKNGYTATDVADGMWIDWSSMTQEQLTGVDKGAYTEDEFRMIRDAFIKNNEQWWADCITIQWHTGLSVGDVCTLEWCNINLPQRKLRKIRNKTKQLIEVVDLHDEVVEVISRAAHSNPDVRWVYHVAAMSYKSNKGNMPTDYGRLCKRLGLPNRGTHAFRRAYIARRLASGAGVASVQREVGHASPEMTRHYERQASPWQRQPGPVCGLTPQA